MSNQVTISDGQLDLFKEYQLGPVHLSRVLPLWDLLPLYLYSRRNELPKDTPISQIPTISHSFEARGERITFDLSPAMIRDTPQSPARFIFPGERESLVSAAIRAIAMRNPENMGIHQDTKIGPLVSAYFTLRSVRAELAATEHTFSHAEVAESLEILTRAVATVTRSRPGQEPIRQPTPYFYSIQNQGEKYIAILNPLESQQIFSGAYRALDYSQFMELPDPLARWIFQYIHAEHIGANSPSSLFGKKGFDISLELLIERGLLSRTRRVRDLIPRVRTSLDILAGSGVLNLTDDSPGYNERLIDKPTGGRRQILGAIWTLFVSENTFEMIFDANTEAKKRTNAVYNHLKPSDRLADKDVVAARERLSKRTATAAKERRAKAARDIPQKTP